MNVVKGIAITGGSGHLGNHLIQTLLSTGFKVRALYSSQLPTLQHPNLTWLQGDITNAKVIHNLVENCQIIIHSAALISIGNKNSDDVYRVNVTGTETVVNVCLEVDNIRLIHISSSNAVKESTNSETFNEERPYKTKQDFIYPYTKAEAEKYVLNAVIENFLNAIIIRPTSIVGAPDYKPSLLGQTILDLKQNKLPAITTGGYNLIDVKDLSQTIINSFNKGIKGEIYLVGGEYCTVEEIAKYSNPDKSPLKISLNLLLFFMPVINISQKIVNSKWPITKESIQTLKLAPKNMDFSKAIKQLNHTYRPAKESIQDFIEWSQQNNNQ